MEAKIDIYELFDVAYVGKIVSTQRLYEIISEAKKPYLAIFLQPVDNVLAGMLMLRAVDALAKSPENMYFYGSYYMQGCMRDDFEFGPVMLFSTDVFRQIVLEMSQQRNYAALYEVWLEYNFRKAIKCIDRNDHLDLLKWIDNTDNSHFDYVDPKNRDVQIEMEQVFTWYLRLKRAVLNTPPFEVDLNSEHFDTEASIIIPVRNRERTIADALDSALAQQTNKPFNVIVVDNHSTDGTTGIIRRYTSDSRVVHIIPETTDLGIGGCWNLAAADPRCGRFAVQLDSDDVYSSPQTLQTIIDKFYTENCAMVVGSYTLIDFNLDPIPPGLVDHREWTDDNGRNNLLRVNGIGAPRAFYTPLLRKRPALNVSYGEDYALALTFSRFYKIGRIYNSIYFCRRWEGNSDARPNTSEKRTQNMFKDQIRTQEIALRIALIDSLKNKKPE